MSGITITRTEDSATFASACGGVTIPLIPGPNTVDTSAMLGTDCVTSIARAFDANTGNSLSPGPQSLSITPSSVQELDDQFTAANGVNISADSPLVGGPWTQRDLTMNIQCDGGGRATMASAGTTRYTAPHPAASPDGDIKLTAHGDTGWSDTVEIGIRWDEATLTGYIMQLVPPNVVNLIARVAGVDTVLQTTTFTMPQLSDPASAFRLGAFGSNLSVIQDTSSLISASDSTIASGTSWMTGGSRTVGQPVYYEEITAEVF